MIKILKHSKQVFVLYISSLLGVLIGVGISVLNTRYLSPGDYGDVRYVFNIISFVSSLLLFGYFVSGSRLLALSCDTNKNRRINGVMTYILIITIIVTILLMIVCYFIHLRWLNPKVASLFLISIPICGAPLLLNYINTSFQGENRIGGIALARLLPSLFYLIIGFCIYYNFGATSELMLLLQNGVAVIILLALIIYTKPSFKGIKESFVILKEENKKYGLHVYIGSIAAVSLGYLGGITLGVFNDDNVAVGYYTLALTIASPLTMLPSIVGTAYFKKFATQIAIGSKVFCSTLLISLLSLVAFILLIHPIVRLLYSEDYSVVAKFASYLAIGTTIHGIGDMFNRFLGSHGKGKELRNGAFLCGIILVIGNLLFVYWWGIYGAITTRIFSSGAYFFAMVYYYKQFTKKPEQKNVSITKKADKRKVHIITTESFPVGMAATNRIICYAKGLIANEVECKIIVVNRTERIDIEQRNFVAKGNFEGIPFEYVSGAVVRSNSFVRRRVDDFVDFIKAIKYCISEIKRGEVILNFYSKPLLALCILISSKLIGLKNIREFCEYPYGTSEESIYNKIRRYFEFRILFPMYTGFVAISKELESEAIKYGGNRAKIIKVPILVELQKEEKEVYLHPRPYIFHCGTMYERKDAIVSTMKAFGMAVKKLDYVVDFILAGPISPHKSEIDEIIKINKLDGNVIFLGQLHKKDIIRYQNGASLAILNKNDNIQNRCGFSTKLGEILLSETPVITTTIGEANNYLEDGVSAYITEPHKPELIAKKILLAFQNVQERQQISKRGKLVAENQFNCIMQGYRLRRFIESL